jgi:hypothetical protein
MLEKPQMKIPRSESAALARRYTLVAYEALLEMLRNPKTSARVRKGVLKTLLDRGVIKHPTSPNDPAQPSKLQ